MVIPRKRKIIPTIFWAKTFAVASHHCESRRSCAVSKAKLEKVVKAPKNPTRIMIRYSLLMDTRCSIMDQINPKKKQPIMLTANVPHGNPIPKERLTPPDNPYLARDPREPARASQISFCRKMASFYRLNVFNMVKDSIILTRRVS